MIVVKVELHSVITGTVREIARMVIANNGTSNDPKRGNYTATTYRGRDKDALDRWKVLRDTQIHNYRRLDLHVWNLVAKALTGMRYG